MRKVHHAAPHRADSELQSASLSVRPAVGGNFVQQDGGTLCEIRVNFGKRSFYIEDGLCVNLADAGFGEIEGFRNLAQAHVFKIIKGEPLSLHIGQLLKPLRHEPCQFTPKSSVQWILLPQVGKALVLRERIIVITTKTRIQANECRRSNFIEPLAI